MKLFNSNLDVIDEAFEYLINQSSKGDKGQYFTPRYVIDMCVRMLNPQEDEYMIDTAAGSSGFPVHTMFHVWNQIKRNQGREEDEMFTGEPNPPECDEYVKKKVFSIDFDEKAVRVARTLNLIAGDGEQNVLHLNALDYELWDEITKEEDWNNTYNQAFSRLKKLRVDKNSYQRFRFDVLMANPLFAGDIKEPRMISRYDLAKKPDGKWQTKVGRDILFIERNLDFLKPGGRMAIVLPQGRFNNSSDKNIRDFIAERCRILSVVGLHGNTFKPHTGTKTSVLLVQKWNDDPKAGALCPRRDDYSIFFATMQKSGKDNSGEKIYIKKSDGSGELLLDEHDHLIIDHDLFNHDGLTQDGIAEAFIEFAKKEKLSFFDLSSSVMPFDAEKYDRLMGELEAVELSMKEVYDDNTSQRIDSEYFKKEFIQIHKKVSQGKKLVDVTTMTDLQSNGAFKFLFDTLNDENPKIIPYIRSSNVGSFFINKEDLEFISEQAHKKFNKTHTFVGDILMARKGKIGGASIITEDCTNFNSNDNVVNFKVTTKEINPYYFTTFFNSRFGLNQVDRMSTGNVQPWLSMFQLRNLWIYILDLSFQSYIEKLVCKAFYLLEDSYLFYQQAEDLLLSELGLQDWQPTEETIAIKSFSESFLSSGRFDAEYYRPKYDELYELLKISCLEKEWDLRKLNSLSSLFKYGSSEPFDYLEKGVPFLRIADLKKYRFSEKDLKFISQEAAKHQQSTVKTGDVLISRSGTLGLAITIPDYLNNAVYGSYFILTRPKQEVILPTYLALYLNSLVGKLQTEQANTGGIQTNLTIPVLESLLIACPPLDIQQRLVDKVNQSYDAAAIVNSDFDNGVSG